MTVIEIILALFVGIIGTFSILIAAGKTEEWLLVHGQPKISKFTYWYYMAFYFSVAGISGATTNTLLQFLVGTSLIPIGGIIALIVLKNKEQAELNH